MRASRALLSLMLVLLMAGMAVAQTPSPSPSVTVEAEQSQGQVSVEKAAAFTFTVRNTSPSSGTPADEQNLGDVSIRITGVPEGWTASATPANFELAPGAAQEVEVQVSVATGADARQANLVVSAEMYSPLRGLEPILGQIPGATQKSTGNATLALTVDDSVTRDLLEAIGPWIYAILLLLVAAVLVAIGLTVASRRTLVRLAADTREVSLPPGGKASLAFRAEGLAREADTVLLRVSAVQEGWAAFLPVPELTLEPGQTQDLTLIVIAPREATQGTRQAILVTATSAKAPKGAANLEFVATVEGPQELPSAPRRRKE